MNGGRCKTGGCINLRGGLTPPDFWCVKSKEVSMTLTRHINPVARAIVVIAAVMALVTGVTFAALKDSVTLQNNTISSANADLLIWDGDSFEQTAAGFTVTNLIPGSGSDDYPFYLKNNGGTPLKLAITVPSAPAEPAGGYGFSGWENLKVTVTNNEPGCADDTLHTDMAALLAGEVELKCNPMTAGAQGDSGNLETEGNFTVSFDIAPESVTGDSPGVGNFDLVITGSAVAVTE